MRPDRELWTSVYAQLISASYKFLAALCLSVTVAAGTSALAQVNVLTRSYDNARTGANLNETILTPANVNPTNFGKLFTVPTDGQLYAQPLYMSNLSIAGGTHNVVFVASMLNTIYAIEADTGATLWTNNYGTPITPKEVETDQNITWNGGIGILSTPVIDPTTNYMYFVSANEAQVNGSPVYSYNLNAISVFTGQPVLGSPMLITGSYSTPDLTNPITFVASKQNQRAALALGNGNIYIAFASHEDIQPYHGWVFAYSASNLAQTAVYSDTTTGIQGGIWNAGGAPTIDANGNVYISTGNGSFGTTPNNLVQTGNSFIKLSPSLELLDYFTPYNSSTLNSGDQDLGASGLLLIPNTNYLLGGGKQGVFYLVDTTDMGKFNSSTDQVRQEYQAVYGKGTSHIHGAPVYFDSAANGPTAYVWGENDVLRSFAFTPTTGLMTTTPLATSTMTAPVTNNDGAMPGGFITMSGNGANNGIAWASTPYNGNAVHQSVQGVVYAFDAVTLATLWSDKDNDARDEIGNFAKYTPPVIANGKLYMASFGVTNNTAGTGALVVYGLLPSVSVSPIKIAFQATPVGVASGYQLVTVANGGSNTLSISSIQIQGTGAGAYAFRSQTCGTSLAAGASCTFYIVFRPTAAGAAAATVSVTDNDPNSPQTVALSGTGTTPPTATLAPTSLTFAGTTVGATSAPQQVTVSNTGSTVLTIASIALSGTNPSSFAISQQSCGATLAAGASCNFSITFSPTTAGSLPASVTLTDGAANSPQVLAITATGNAANAPTVTLLPATLTFPATMIGTTSAYQLLTLSNTGTSAITVSSISLSGAAASSYGIREQTCGTSLAAGSSCTFYVAFRPNTSGTLPVQVRAADNATSSPQIAMITGTGVGPTVSLTPATVTFPATLIGTATAAQQVTLTNTGKIALTIGSIGLSGTNASSFAITQQACGSTLAVGASCAFSVTATPLTSGSLTAAVTLTDSGQGAPHSVSLAASGNSTSGPSAVMAPATLTFPSTAIGGISAYQLITLSNPGSAVLNITSIQLSGADASQYGLRLQTCGATLAAGSSCTFYVVFRPTVAGTFPVLVRAVDNAGSGVQTVSVTGTAP